MIGRLLAHDAAIFRPLSPPVLLSLFIYGIPMYRFGQYQLVLFVYSIGVLFSLFGIEQRYRTAILLKSLPVSSSTVVGARYFIALLCIVGITAYGVALAPLYELMFRWHFDAFRRLIQPAALFFLFSTYLVIVAAVLPAVFRFGLNRGVGIATVMILSLCGFLLVAYVIIRPERRLQETVRALFAAFHSTGTAATVTAVCATLYGVSFLFAKNLYDKRDL